MAVTISYDGRWLASAGDEGTIRLWELHEKRLIARLRRAVGRDLTESERQAYHVPSPDDETKG